MYIDTDIHSGLATSCAAEDASEYESSVDFRTWLPRLRWRIITPTMMVIRHAQATTQARSTIVGNEVECMRVCTHLQSEWFRCRQVHWSWAMQLWLSRCLSPMTRLASMCTDHLAGSSTKIQEDMAKSSTHRCCRCCSGSQLAWQSVQHLHNCA